VFNVPNEVPVEALLVASTRGPVGEAQARQREASRGEAQARQHEAPRNDSADQPGGHSSPLQDVWDSGNWRNS
jgi:hypothetical protein